MGGILPPKPPAPSMQAEPPAPAMKAEATHAASDQARSALLAAADGPVSQAQTVASGQPTSPEGLQDLVSKLKGNPEALEQAKAMMKDAPPELLSQISGGKVSPEQAAKTLGRLQEMSAEDIIDVVTTEEEAQPPT